MLFTRKIFFFNIVLGVFLISPAAQAVTKTAAETYAGKIILQYQKGTPLLWYVSPNTKQRYLLEKNSDATKVLALVSTSISTEDLNKIPTKQGQPKNTAIVNPLKGLLVMDNASSSAAWYISPASGYRYTVTLGPEAFTALKKFAITVSLNTLRKIPINHELTVMPADFTDYATVRYNGSSFSRGRNDDVILPMASLTKLMTALVLLDQKINWNKKITITQSEIDYPIQYVGTDGTSEVGIAAGDTVTFNDLWVAMLLSSANRAAAALVDSTGMGREAFVKLMNQKAADLGLAKTVFYDVAGLNERNVTTPREMAIIAATAFSYSKITKTTVLKQYVMRGTDAAGTKKNIMAVNRNTSLMKFYPSAVKVGYLTEAQRNVAIKKGKIVGIVMHALSHTQRDQLSGAMIK